MAPAGGKGKKKWSKGKVKDKAQHAVLLDKTTSDKLYKDVQSYRLVTIATLVDRLKINGSLARQCLADLEEKGQIKPVVTHSKMKIYSMLQSMYSKIAARLWAEGCILGGETRQCD
ncbi:40S ribosomal protein S25 [Pyricularia oryzae Y34]|uniref:40S ribosomal protein S25 n=2 Tax=Pyricularia oryzae TaxID=318829 RepID=A0AA97NYB7_PYRO3|nr:40S ribosomal protein S25 [Pyricularia oryzae Y34]